MPILSTYGIFEKDRQKFAEAISNNTNLPIQELKDIFFNYIAKDLILELNHNYCDPINRGYVINPPRLKSIIEDSFKISISKHKDKLGYYDEDLEGFISNVINKLAGKQNHIIDILDKYKTTYKFSQSYYEKCSRYNKYIPVQRIHIENATNNAQELLTKLAGQYPEWAEQLKFSMEFKKYIEENSNLKQSENKFQNLVTRKPISSRSLY